MAMKQIVMAGVLACVGTTWASGEVIYKNFGTTLSYNLLEAPMSLDLNEDGTGDFSLTAFIAPPLPPEEGMEPDTGYSAFFTLAATSGGSFSFSGGFTSIPEASSIGPSSGWWIESNGNRLATVGRFNDDGTRTWTDVLAEEGSHTVAVRFDAEGGGQHYGWIRFRDSNDANPTEWGPQVFDLAYNSVPDQPILSAIVPVPEPTTAALAVLGAVALGARARHRRAQG